MSVETRKFNSEIRAGQGDEDQLTLIGRAVQYNTLSAPMGRPDGIVFRERVSPGAFTKSLSADDQTADWNHNESILPLGRKSAGTLNLQDKEDGLYFRITLDPNQQLHCELHSAVKRGDVKSCSWAFVPDKGGEQWSDDSDVRNQLIRTITSCKLFAVTICNNPAYPIGTTVQARAAQNVEDAEMVVLRWRVKEAGRQIAAEKLEN